jgi:AcrR family transcriptional regulator
VESINEGGAVARELRPALPGQRRHVTRQDVVASQRDRLLDAVTQAVAHKGYAATTVADIVRPAGVSRTTFYEHFDGKLECFLEAYQLGFDEVLDRMNQAALAADDGWIERLRASGRSLLTTLAETPDFARAFFVEILAAGPDALEARARVMRQFADALAGPLRLARAQRPDLVELPQHTLDAIVGGMTELIAIHVRAGRFDELPALEPVWMHLALAVLLGNQDAAAALHQPTSPDVTAATATADRRRRRAR